MKIHAQTLQRNATFITPQPVRDYLSKKNFGPIQDSILT